jgi:DNA polymerase III epsilon subunit-like protein
MNVRDGEIFISVDVEASGPIPADYSMLAIGACLVHDLTQTFYIEIQPVSDKFVPAALKVTGLSLDRLKTTGTPPAQAMNAFADWVTSAASGGTPVFVGFNATFDWAFVNWYFQHFTDGNPFGIGGLDIKSFYMGMAGTGWTETRSSKLPARFKSPRTRHTHNALSDAIEQAGVFETMLAESLLLSKPQSRSRITR